MIYNQPTAYSPYFLSVHIDPVEPGVIVVFIWDIRSIFILDFRCSLWYVGVECSSGYPSYSVYCWLHCRFPVICAFFFLRDRILIFPWIRNSSVCRFQDISSNVFRYIMQPEKPKEGLILVRSVFQKNKPQTIIVIIHSLKYLTTQDIAGMTRYSLTAAAAAEEARRTREIRREEKKKP